MNSVIFDLDGTILDTLDDLTDSMNWSLASLEQPACTREQVRQMVGDGVRNFALRALPPQRADLRDELVSIMRQRYSENCMKKTRPYQGVVELLDKLRHTGAALAVVTNKDQAMARSLVGRYFPGIFDKVLGVVDQKPVKPDPDAVNGLIGQQGWEKVHTFMVGDSGIDIDTARAAGIRSVGVSWGFRDKEELLRHGADAIIDVPAELLALLP